MNNHERRIQNEINGIKDAVVRENIRKIWNHWNSKTGWVPWNLAGAAESLARRQGVEEVSMDRVADLKGLIEEMMAEGCYIGWIKRNMSSTEIAAIADSI